MPKASLLCSLTVALERDSVSLVSRSGSADFWGAVGARGGEAEEFWSPWMREGEVPKVTQCPGGFSPGVPKTKHNFHND